jgi:hypothetical protein
MAERHKELLLSSLIQGTTNIGGTKFPEAVIKQTTVIFCPGAPLTILVTDILPFELITFGTSVGPVLMVEI